MSTQNKLQSGVVHESEVQRQHIRLPLPATVVLAGKSYIVKDLSAGGFSVTDIEGKYEPGEAIDVRIVLPFGSFSMDVSIKAIVRYHDSGKKLLGCSFIDLSSEQISILNHVLKAFLAGDIVTSGGVLNVAGRENFSKARKQPGAQPDAGTTINIRRQLPGLAVIGLLGLAAAFIVFSNVYQSLFIVKSSEAVVRSPVMTIRAVNDGYYSSALGPDTVTVKPDQAVATVTPANGSNLVSAIKSPCDCYITEMHLQKGEFVTAGTPLLSVVDIAAEPSIRAVIDPQKARKIGINHRVRILIVGSQSEYTGRVTDIVTDLSPIAAMAGIGATASPIYVDIAADQKIPVDLTGRPAQVVFTGR